MTGAHWARQVWESIDPSVPGPINVKDTWKFNRGRWDSTVLMRKFQQNRVQDRMRKRENHQY